MLKLQSPQSIRIFVEKTMASIAITNKTLDKYFGLLRRLDNNSKKRLIIKLTESLETKDDSSFDLKSIYGAWDDSKDSDEIIKNIRSASGVSTVICRFIQMRSDGFMYNKPIYAWFSKPSDRYSTVDTTLE